MNRIPLAALTVLTVTVMGVISMLEQPEALEAQSHAATRSFQEDWAAPGSELQVSVTASDYGAFGQVVEDLPDGFTFAGSSLDEAHIEIDGQTVRFNLLGETGFTYSVNVPTAEGLYTFSGVIKNVDREEQAIGGDSSLRVGQAPTQTPSPTSAPASTPTTEQTATPEHTPEPAATPEPTSTPEPAPEPTATPEPKATPEPTPEPTATPEPSATPTIEATADEPAATAPLTAATSTSTPPTETPTPMQEPIPSQPEESEAEGESSSVVPGLLVGLAIVVIIGGLNIFVRRRA